MPSERNTFKMSCDVKECSGRKAAGGSPEESPRRVNHQETELFPTPPEGFSLGKRHADKAGLCIRSMANRLLLSLLKYPSL